MPIYMFIGVLVSTDVSGLEIDNGIKFSGVSGHKVGSRNCDASTLMI